ncbi:MAG: DUF169 domain-containing protein [Mailhella sp.]|nr:DUF169 domain-containing protein [Mailhella sp.]
MTDFLQIHETLMKHLHLMHYPVAMFLLPDEAAKQEFLGAYEFHTPVKQVTFCQAELGARMEGLSIMVDAESLWCRNAKITFGMTGIEPMDLKKNAKFCEDEQETLDFIESKPRLEKAPAAIAMMPLGNCRHTPDAVHFCCDNMQAYHLLDDWMATQHSHPFHPNMCMNSAVCGGFVFTAQAHKANLTLACGGSYNSGKMERGEINVYIPGAHIAALAGRLQERVLKHGGPSITRLGDPYPGADICQNCPLIVFKKVKQPS